MLDDDFKKSADVTLKVSCWIRCHHWQCFAKKKLHDLGVTLERNNKKTEESKNPRAVQVLDCRLFPVPQLFAALDKFVDNKKKRRTTLSPGERRLLFAAWRVNFELRNPAGFASVREKFRTGTEYTRKSDPLVVRHEGNISPAVNAGLTEGAAFGAVGSAAPRRA